MFSGVELLWSIVEKLWPGVAGFGLKWWWDRKERKRQDQQIESLNDQIEDAAKKTKSAVTDAHASADQKMKEQLEKFNAEAETAYGKLAIVQKENGVARDELAKLRAILEERDGVLTAGQARLDALLDRLKGSEASLWQSQKPRPPFENYNSRVAREPVLTNGPARPVVLTLVNYKGGVGKTTTTGNLAERWSTPTTPPCQSANSHSSLTRTGA